MVDEAGIELHRVRAGADLGVGRRRAVDAADAYNGEVRARGLAEEPDEFGRPAKTGGRTGRPPRPYWGSAMPSAA